MCGNLHLNSARANVLDLLGRISGAEFLISAPSRSNPLLGVSGYLF